LRDGLITAADAAEVYGIGPGEAGNDGAAAPAGAG